MLSLLLVVALSNNVLWPWNLH